MRSGPFITLIASTYGLPEQTVALVARLMREAGWLTTGARGVNAPHMEAHDGARLSIALLTGQTPNKTVEEFEFIRTLRTNFIYPEGAMINQDDLPPRHTFEDAVVYIFEFFQDSEKIAMHSTHFSKFTFLPKMSVSVDVARRTASIRHKYSEVIYEDIDGQEEASQLRSGSWDKWQRSFELDERSAGYLEGRIVAGRGMREVRTITEEEISVISERILHD